MEEEAEEKTIWGLVTTIIIIIFIIGLLISYWFIPFGKTQFKSQYGHTNFTLNNSDSMQFYPNMRFPYPNISYKIYDCTLEKKNEMLRAFDLLANETLLKFYSTENNEEISVSCDSQERIEGGLFIAGEGGPTEIAKINNLYLISHGNILLIRPSECSNPNIATHELLHVLGFTHSPNPENIMYNTSNCNQELGDDIISLIDKLYSITSYPDLTIESASADVHERYIDVNISVRNNGLIPSKESKILIFADSTLEKEINLETIQAGFGRSITLQNILTFKLKIDKIEFEIQYDSDELNKENNKITLD